MPVPKRKRSRARRDSRFANKGIQAAAVGSCLSCNVAVQPHSACHGCGFYQGRKIFTPKSERSIIRTLARKEIAAKVAARKQGGQGSSDTQVQ
jgi:large subunit ribosomal protein L32